MTANILYNFLWECIEYFELVAGLEVLYICCDGAVQNRTFFSVHADGTEFVYKPQIIMLWKTDIYFVSDPPHLLKATRNCFSNFFAHTDCRHLWYHGNISCAHVEVI